MRAPSTITILPFVTGTLLALYVAWGNEGRTALWIIPFFVIAAIIYVMSPQIDWWWYDCNPPKLEDKMIALIERYSAVYQTFNESKKKFFLDRTALIVLTKNYMPMGGMETVPSDIEVWIAAHLAALTMNIKEDFEVAAYENVVTYPKMFPSPQFPLVFHASEIYQEDGVLMLGIEPMMRGITLPKQYYNVVLHEWIKVYIERFEPTFEANNQDNWAKLAEISGYTREHIVTCIGLDDVDFRVASIHHFFHFQTNFQAQLPQLYNEYRLLFYQDKK